ncbi:MAG: FGGY family carbohydrate kinase [Corynebacteriales bacterium]|nr:FGGY family carbohydrate kinase [Mycobacteriales bacterium]
MTARLVAGLDLGSTGVKMLVADVDGSEILIESRPTPWRNGPGGTTDMDADALEAVVVDLMSAVARRLPDDTRIEAVAVSGMGETGFLVDPAGAVAAPAFAWFDPRGAAEMAALPEHLRRDFPAHTGLPVGAQVSVAKIAHLRTEGLDLTGLRWFNLPEFVVRMLGGAEVGEYSLASRTGLLDQDTGGPWTALLDHLGIGDDILPALVDAGTDLGSADTAWLPAAFTGARLTVAGHDHLVSAEAGGAIPADGYHVSMGTAEVLLRVLDEPPSAQARARLAEHLINAVRHVVPGKHVLVAGVKTGLIMRRTLQMFDISERDGRDRLDDRVCALPQDALAHGGIEVTGARNDDGVLSLTVRTDGVSSAEIFAAVVEHGNDEIVRLIAALDREIAPARSTVLTGGWSGMRCVRDARARILPAVTVSTRSQDTAYGATRFAARLLAPHLLAPHLMATDAVV